MSGLASALGVTLRVTSTPGSNSVLPFKVAAGTIILTGRTVALPIKRRLPDRVVRLAWLMLLLRDGANLKILGLLRVNASAAQVAIITAVVRA